MAIPEKPLYYLSIHEAQELIQKRAAETFRRSSCSGKTKRPRLPSSGFLNERVASF